MKKTLWINILLMINLSSSAQANEQSIIYPYLGDGVAAEVGSNEYAWRFNVPSDVFIDRYGQMYIADTVNNQIRCPAFVNLMSPGDSVLTGIEPLIGTGEAGFSGDGGLATEAKLNHPMGMVVDSKGNIYIADQYNHRIRKAKSIYGESPAPFVPLIIDTVAGNSMAGNSGDHGFAKDALLNRPSDVAVDQNDNLYLADEGNNVIRKIDGTTGIITTVVGVNDGLGGGFSGDGGPATAAQLKRPTGVVVDQNGNLYIADNDNQVIRKVEASTGIIRTLAGTPNQTGFFGDEGPATVAKFNAPVKLEIDTTGNYLYISDYWNSRIREITMENGMNVIDTLAGSTSGNNGDLGLAKNAQLNGPAGLAMNRDGTLYVADSLNHRIRRISDAAPPYVDLPENCTANRCSYGVFLEGRNGGRYVFSINLASGSHEGMFGLTITAEYPFGGYNAGAVLKDQGGTPSFAQVFLSNPASFSIALAEYTGIVNTMIILVEREDRFGHREPVYGPIETAYNSVHRTPQLAGGFWYTVTVNSPYYELNRGQVGFTVTGSDFPGGITLGGWVDGKTGSTGEGFTAFTNLQNQYVTLDLLFGNNYSTVGAGPLVLDICYQDDRTGERRYYWSNQVDGSYSCIQ